MANDLLDHLMADFSSARTTHQAAWNSLLRTGLPYDPNDGLRHSLFHFEKRPEGFQVMTVVPDGPADQAGLKIQDVITKINDADIASLSPEELAKAFSGESYTIVVDRPGGVVTLTVHPLPYAELVKAVQH